MARPRFALAKQKAEELLHQLGHPAPPIDVARLIKMRGCLLIIDEHLEDDVSGALVHEADDQPYIVVNGGHSSLRQRFTMAHELGHHVLHKIDSHIDKQILLRNAESSKAESVLEVEANQFAANLLMPAPMLERDIAKRERLDFEDLVRELHQLYGVSEQAMTLRIAKLKKYGL